MKQQFHRPKPGDTTPCFLWQKPSEPTKRTKREAGIQTQAQLVITGKKKKGMAPHIQTALSKAQQAAIALESPAERKARHALKKATRDNTVSNFNVEIPTLKSRDRTRSIGGGGR